MRVLSLFSGVGMHDLGLEWAGFEIAGQVEIDAFCRKVLKKHWPNVPRGRDVARCRGTKIIDRCGPIDLLTGGFPCTSISPAGKGAGIYGKESNLFFEMLRIIKEIRPRWVLIENSANLRTRGADVVLVSLEKLGYACWPTVLGAWAYGAPHRRDRVWIVGYFDPNGRLRQKMAESAGNEIFDASGADGDVGYTAGERKRKSSDEANAKSISRSAQTGRGVSGSGSRMADTDGYAVWKQLRRSGRKRRAEKTSEPTNRREAGVGVADASFARLERERARTSRPVKKFPMPPGRDQFRWEPPRLKFYAQSRFRPSADGHAARMARRRRVEQLKALGNGNPPQSAWLMGIAIKRLDEYLTGGVC